MNPITLSDSFDSLWPPVGTFVEDGPKSHCPSYTRPIFTPESFREIVDWAAGYVKQARLHAIAGSGHSGVLVAAAVAYKVGIPVIAVRQREEDGGNVHDSYMVNAILKGNERYAIIDDLVATGRTIRRIVRWVAEAFPDARPEMVLLYKDTSTSKAMIQGLERSLRDVLVLQMGAR